jgi:hypothetical protein
MTNWSAVQTLHKTGVKKPASMLDEYLLTSYILQRDFWILHSSSDIKRRAQDNQIQIKSVSFL